METAYSTKVTNLGKCYGCRIYYNDVLILEGRCEGREQIGPTFRDLFRTLDKCGGDKFTSAVRKRKFKEGNLCTQVKHIWHSHPGIL